MIKHKTFEDIEYTKLDGFGGVDIYYKDGSSIVGERLMNYTMDEAQILQSKEKKQEVKIIRKSLTNKEWNKKVQSYHLYNN